MLLWLTLTILLILSLNNPYFAQHWANAIIRDKTYAIEFPLAHTTRKSELNLPIT